MIYTSTYAEATFLVPSFHKNVHLTLQTIYTSLMRECTQRRSMGVHLARLHVEGTWWRWILFHHAANTCTTVGTIRTSPRIFVCRREHLVVWLIKFRSMCSCSTTGALHTLSRGCSIRGRHTWPGSRLFRRALRVSRRCGSRSLPCRTCRRLRLQAGYTRSVL